MLDLWLDAGPTSMPDDSVENALRAVAVTPQRRWRGRLVRFSGASPLVPVGLTVAAIAAVVALGIGIGSVLPPSGTEVSPTPEPSGPPSGLVVFTNPRDGYELTLPASWTPAEFLSNPPGTMRFGAAHSDNGPSSFGALTVSIGSTDGIVRDCAPGPCRPIVATTIDALDAAIANGSTDITTWITTTDVDVTLDGEPARLEYVTFGGGLIEAGPQFHHLFAIHDGRPIVLSFDKYAQGLGGHSNDIGWVESLIRGFRFLEVAPDSPTTGTFSFPEFGYELSLPEGWTQTGTLDPSAFATQSGYGTATVVVGDEASRIWTCTEPAGPWEVCQRVTAPGLDALTAAVEPRSADEHGIPVPGTITRDTMLLDGEDANLVGVQAYEYPARGFEHVTYILAFHDGRPFILRFHTMLSGPPDGWISEFLSGFRFLD